MKKVFISAATCLFALSLAQNFGIVNVRFFESVAIDSVLQIDSIAARSDVPAAGKIWITGGGVGSVRAKFSNGAEHNLDSLTTLKSSVAFGWYNWTTADSVPVWKPDASCTIDSISAFHTGASSLTYNAIRIRSGTPVDLLSSNASATTTWVGASGLQNNSLLANDQIWVVIRSLTGTATQFTIQIYYHY